MEVDKSRAALTSGETPLPLCGGRSGKGISQSATGGDPSRLEKRGEAAYDFQSMVNI